MKPVDVSAIAGGWVGEIFSTEDGFKFVQVAEEPGALRSGNFIHLRIDIVEFIGHRLGREMFAAGAGAAAGAEAKF